MPTIKIDSCEQCRFLERERNYTPDPFEMVLQWWCRGNGRVIANVDTWDPIPSIPDWCPLLTQDSVIEIQGE